MKKLLVLLTLAAVPASSVRADIVIDDFATSQFLVTNGTASNQSGPNAGVFGSYREMILTVIPAGGGANISQVIASNNTLSIGNGNGLKSILEVRYDGVSFGGAYNPTGVAPPVDVTQAGLNKGLVFTARNDASAIPGSAGATVSVTLSSSALNQSSASVTLLESGNGFISYFVPFTSFLGTANLNAISGIKFVVDTTNDFAEDVDLFHLAFAVPAPSGIVLGGMALALGLAFAWRRHRTMSVAAAL